VSGRLQKKLDFAASRLDLADLERAGTAHK
jgi:hypothetical protein